MLSKLKSFFSWEKFAAGSLILWVVLILAFFVGYIANIVKIMNMDGGITITFILRVVGIFAAPFGALMGIFV